MLRGQPRRGTVWPSGKGPLASVYTHEGPFCLTPCHRTDRGGDFTPGRVCSRNSRGSREGGRLKACFSGGPRPMPVLHPAWRPLLPGLRCRRGPHVTSLTLCLGPSAAGNELGQHTVPAGGARAAAQVLRPPPAAACFTLSVPCHRGSLKRHRRHVRTRCLSVLAHSSGFLSSPWPLLGPQARSLLPESGSPGLVPCSLLVMLLTQTSSAAPMASGGSPRCPRGHRVSVSPDRAELRLPPAWCISGQDVPATHSPGNPSVLDSRPPRLHAGPRQAPSLSPHHRHQHRPRPKRRSLLGPLHAPVAGVPTATRVPAATVPVRPFSSRPPGSPCSAGCRGCWQRLWPSAPL